MPFTILIPLEYDYSGSHRAVIIQINKIGSFHSYTSMGNCQSHTVIYLWMECASIRALRIPGSWWEVQYITIIRIRPFFFQNAADTACRSVLPSSDAAWEGLLQLPFSVASFVYIHFAGTLGYPYQPVCITSISFGIYKLLLQCLRIIILTGYIQSGIFQITALDIYLISIAQKSIYRLSALCCHRQLRSLLQGYFFTCRLIQNGYFSFCRYRIIRATDAKYTLRKFLYFYRNLIRCLTEILFPVLSLIRL